MNKVRIEAPDLKEAFEKTNNDILKQLKVVERQYRRRKVVMWVSLVVSAISLTIAVIKCLS